MKTTGLNFLEAIKALSEGKCDKIQNSNGTIYYTDDKILADSRVSPTRFKLDIHGILGILGEWKLIGVKQKIEDVGWLEGDCPNRQVCRARLTQKAQNEDDFGVG